MEATKYLSMTELEAGMEYIRQSPGDRGVLKMIVRRPEEDEREVVEARAELDLADGLVGDNWKTRGNKHTPDGSANPNAQITVMNARAIELLALEQERWSLAGDQLYIDMDLSDDNIPPGTRARDRFSHYRSLCRTAYGLSEVFGTVRCGGHEVCQLARGKTTSLTRNQYEDRPGRSHSRGRCSEENTRHLTPPMARSSDKMDVYLEVGQKRTFAGALDWPGWCRSGRRRRISAASSL